MADQPREESLFLAARDRQDARERAEYLEIACEGDTALYGRVQELLRLNDQSQGPLDGPPPGMATWSLNTVGEEPGDQIGPYKLREQIGEGGFGVVYVAAQEKPVRRKVALKIVKPGMDTKDVIARFEAEQQALALMDHPNVARVLDAGSTKSGRPYFVMELVHGVKITEFCDKNRLSMEDRLKLFIDICHAVQHAHQKGIIHRDLKPNNILVTLHDGKPVPKVIDFGVAKALSQQLTEKTIYTSYGQMIGTPEYMSPEQAEMSGLGIDTRSDIYSLGVLLYELLVGRPPFEAKRLRASGFEGILKIIREEEPPRPSTKVSTMGQEATMIAEHRRTDVAKLRQSLQGELDWIVMKALEKDRGRRYDTANSFVADVQRFLDDEPVEACPPSTTYKLRKFVRRNKGPVIVAAALLVTMSLGLVGTTLGLFMANAAAKDASEAKEETRIKLYRSLVEQARALQLARRSGYRTDVWQILKDAIDIGETLVNPSELRSIAVACLDEPNRLLRPRTHSIPDAGAWSLFELTERHLALGSDDGRILVCDPLDGTVKASLRGGHSDAIVSVVKLAREETWASSDDAGNIVVWRRKAGNAAWSVEPRLRPDGIGGIPRLLACGDGMLAYAAGSSKVLIWENLESSQPRVVPLPFEVVNDGPLRRSVGVSPDGRFLLVSGKAASDRGVSAHVWDLTAKAAKAKVAELPAPIGGGRILFSGDGTIAVCASEKQVMVYDAREWTRLSSRPSRSWLGADNLAISGNGRIIVFGGGMKTIWNLEFDLESSVLAKAEGHPILSEDGSRLMVLQTTQSEWSLDRWELGRSDTMLMEEAHSGNVFGLNTSPDGRYLASCGIDGQVNLWSLDPWERVPLERAQFDTPVEDPSFSFDGRLLAVVNGTWMGRPADSRITFWDLKTRRQIHSDSFGNTHGLVSFHDASPLVAAAAGNSLGVWRYRLEPGPATDDVHLQLEPIQVRELQRPSAMVAFDSRARYVFWSEIEETREGGGFSRSILRAIDLETGRMLPFNQPVGSGWNEFALLPDGRRVVLAACGSTGQPGRIEIWDFLENVPLAQFAESSFPEAPTPSVMGLHPNGRYLVFQSTKNESLELWDIETERMISRFPLPEGIITQSRGAVAGLKWGPNGELAVPLSTGQIRIWNIPAVRRALAELGLDWEDKKVLRNL